MALIGSEGQVLYSYYASNQGSPIETARAAMQELSEKMPATARIARDMAEFRRDRDGPITGALPLDLVVAVIEIGATRLKVETPAGYTGWVERVHVVMVDGPGPQAPTLPDPRRQMIADIRTRLDALDAAL